MNGLHYALYRTHDAERHVVVQLDDLTARHRDEHEVRHVVTELRRWSADHVEALAELGHRRGARLDRGPTGHGPARRMASAAAHLLRRPNAGTELLEDMHDLYLAASHASLAWEMLAQICQAQHDRDLLDLVGRCHPQTLRQIRWANTMLKTLSPQILSSL